MPALVFTMLAAPAPAPAPARLADADGVMGLFWQSADVFTGVILVCSIISVAIIIRAFIQIRDRNVLPESSVRELRERVRAADAAPLRDFVEKDDSFASRVIRAGLRQSHTGRTGAREAAELTASEECAAWFRKIELLNVIGHLGPLLGLVGTVYGMIIAFAALGVTGGQAGPGELSLGIAKALFHTFFGLLLAIPSLMAYGYFRTVVDRICTRAMVVSSELFESIPSSAFTERE
ncbi:MAG: MotA/TolQ/ExbB proton channel family protein [Phycisphaerales bacterium]|nr:MAG: MotA/TolQ/ExbB proton channel family protein [Phycisphaerales bacterium]